ncbi:T-cell ecto-ADP-ribosyltransferase 1-like [Astyanax mexicanus]|uniref:T-cell ecto-ADP-ribosyltransferase 1-like n=1 Tax=Astyanax mexicanus TaxID=7994 RepID=UPI0020CB3449|nr:T-cell ecto-ADP-ribosyltransferase 1-like [Astyanax mexicanus]
MGRLFIIVIILAMLTAPGMSMMKASSSGSEDQIVLNLYLNSIDDAFDECKDKMRDLIKTKYLEKELNDHYDFGKDWEKAKSFLKLEGKSDDELRKLALSAYTGHVFEDLNTKMRSGRKHYMTTFGLISLHFLITDGIQHLNPNNKCQTTYRFGSDKYVIKGDKIRFGSFASSSRNPDLSLFGRVTCFIIETCFGADISVLSPSKIEAEVLIPPYEVFNNVYLSEKEIPKELSDCRQVYKLKSTKVKKNNMNCELLNMI